jgi:hypothetical protein
MCDLYGKKIKPETPFNKPFQTIPQVLASVLHSLSPVFLLFLKLDEFSFYPCLWLVVLVTLMNRREQEHKT